MIQSMKRYHSHSSSHLDIDFNKKTFYGPLLNEYDNRKNCVIWIDGYPLAIVETPLRSHKVTVGYGICSEGRIMVPISSKMTTVKGNAIEP